MSDVLLGAIFTLTAAATPGSPGARFMGGLLTGGDVEDGGDYFVAGTVAIDSTPDIPVHRKVRLICAVSARLVRETWSDEITGAYRFGDVRQGPWTVLAHDYTGTYNAVVADNIMGELQ